MNGKWIAAIVIIGIVLAAAYILSIVSPFQLPPDPQKDARKALYQAATTLQTQTSPSFYLRNGDRLSSLGLTMAIQILTPHQLCLSKGDFETDERFEFTSTPDYNYHSIWYNSKDGIWVKYSAYCSTGLNLGSVVSQGDGNANWVGSFECQQMIQKYPTETVCLLAFRQG